MLRILSPRDQNQAVKPTQFGISVSQKVSKKAVKRNRIKRQLQGIINTCLPRIGLGYQVVIVVKRNAMECKYEHFLRELKELLINAEIIHGHKREYLL